MVSKTNFFNKILLRYFFLVLILFVIDRITKFLIIQKFLTEKNQEIVINNFVNFVLVWNQGVGFGLFPIESFKVYTIISVLIFLVNIWLIIWFFKSNKLSEKLFIAIILGGSLGNLVDRIYYRSVPDFIDLHYGNFHWFTFNFADISITIGILGLLLSEFIKKNEKN
ncbi:MAG: signal peptidase II [Candidatus Fonsibacter sp.]